MFKRPWYSTARKKQVSYLHNFRSVQITAWPIKLVWKGEIINNFVPFQRNVKITKIIFICRQGRLALEISRVCHSVLACFVLYISILNLMGCRLTEQFIFFTGQLLQGNSICFEINWPFPFTHNLFVPFGAYK